ncbi:hypothetical protein V2J09_010311 [Rumex salicifolius]
MATNLLTFHPIAVRASASGAGNRTSGTSSRISFSSASSSSSSAPSNWWSPIFGWSSEPDYMDFNSGKISEDQDDSPAKSEEREAKPSRSKFSPGSFTEDKARRLRMMTTGTEAFHDAMYHSAIASRLASDFSTRSDL